MSAAPTIRNTAETSIDVEAQPASASPKSDSPESDSLSASVDPRSTSEVLKELRRAFPDMPLTERVAALNALSRT